MLCAVSVSCLCCFVHYRFTNNPIAKLPNPVYGRNLPQGYILQLSFSKDPLFANKSKCISQLTASHRLSPAASDPW